MYFVMKPRGYGKCYKEYKEVIDYYEQEIARLNEIIDELGKWLWKELERHNYSSIKLKPLKSGNTIRVVSITRLMEVLDKLQELKGSDKE